MTGTITPPEIVDVPEQMTAILPLRVPSSEIQTHMGPGIQEIFAVLKAQGLTPAGPWFSHHKHAPNAFFDFEISVPVSQPVAASGRVKPGRMPAHKVIRTVYHGGYEGLGNGWGQFLKWIDAQGLKTKDALWEVYVSGPESGEDSSKYQTQLNKPLAD